MRTPDPVAVELSARAATGLGDAGRGRAGLRGLPRAGRHPAARRRRRRARRRADRSFGARRRGAGCDRGRDRPAVRRAGPARCWTSCSARPGWTAAEAAVLNVVKCRPPGNRTPKAPEVARCSGWLRRQLELLDPPVVRGARAVVGEVVPRAPRPCWRRRARRPARRSTAAAVWATYHPSAAIRFGPNGAPRAALLADLRRVAARSGGAAVRRDARAARPPRTPTRSASRSPGCCAPGTWSSCRAAGRRQDRAHPGHRRRPRRDRSRSPRRPSSSPACTAAGGCRWCTSTPTGWAAWPTSTTWTSTPPSSESVTVVEWGHGLVEQLADEHLEVELDPRGRRRPDRDPGAARPVVDRPAGRPRPVRRRATVRVLLLDDADRVLLFHDSDAGLDPVVTWWMTPGGGIDPGEDDVSAAVPRARRGDRAAGGPGRGARPAGPAPGAARVQRRGGRPARHVLRRPGAGLHRLHGRAHGGRAAHAAGQPVVDPRGADDARPRRSTRGGLHDLLDLADDPASWPRELPDVDESTLP